MYDRWLNIFLSGSEWNDLTSFVTCNWSGVLAVILSPCSMWLSFDSQLCLHPLHWSVACFRDHGAYHCRNTFNESASRAKGPHFFVKVSLGLHSFWSSSFFKVLIDFFLCNDVSVYVAYDWCLCLFFNLSQWVADLLLYISLCIIYTLFS